MDESAHRRLHWAAAALVAAALVLAILVPGAAHLCGIAITKPSDLGSRPIDGSAGACAEFWLNRYQTLTAGLLALGAAAISIVSYRRQALFAQHSIIHSRIEAMRADVAEFEKAITDIGRCDERLEDLRRSMSTVITRSGTIGVGDADAALNLAGQRMQNFGAGIRKNISGRQVGPPARADADRFVEACDTAADQMRLVFDAASYFIAARDEYKRKTPILAIDASATFEEAVYLNLTVAEATDAILVVTAPAERLQRALRNRVEQIENRISEYDQLVERALTIQYWNLARYNHSPTPPRPGRLRPRPLTLRESIAISATLGWGWPSG